MNITMTKSLTHDYQKVEITAEFDASKMNEVGVWVDAQLKSQMDKLLVQKGQLPEKNTGGNKNWNNNGNYNKNNTSSLDTELFKTIKDYVAKTGDKNAYVEKSALSTMSDQDKQNYINNLKSKMNIVSQGVYNPSMPEVTQTTQQESQSIPPMDSNGNLDLPF